MSAGVRRSASCLVLCKSSVPVLIAVAVVSVVTLLLSMTSVPSSISARSFSCSSALTSSFFG